MDTFQTAEHRFVVFVFRTALEDTMNPPKMIDGIDDRPGDVRSS